MSDGSLPAVGALDSLFAMAGSYAEGPEAVCGLPAGLDGPQGHVQQASDCFQLASPRRLAHQAHRHIQQRHAGALLSPGGLFLNP